MNALTAVVTVIADYDGHHGVDDGWEIAMMTGMGLFWLLVALGVIWAVRTGFGRGDGLRDALTVLDHSLAEGKISVEDYEQRRRILSSGGSAIPPESP